MFKRLLVPAVLGCLLIATFVWLTTAPYWVALRKIGMVMRVMHEEYVDAQAVDYDKLARAAITGMTASLDRYTGYMEAREFRQFTELTRQNYVGIGVEIEQINGKVVVVRVFAGGAAQGAGVLPGDRILAVGETDVSGFTVAEVSAALRGGEGESVEVRFARPGAGDDEEYVATMVRRRVSLASVEDVRIEPDGIGYLRITHFGDETAGELRAALRELEAAGMRGLIIDLRNNPGGILHVAKDVASEFIPDGELVVYTQGRDPKDRREYRSSNDRPIPDYPVVVLINEDSASASEIVAGALQDAGRAVVVGETSHGKGSVQSIYGFRSGDGLRQTTALYYLPSGRSINESGVVPDHVVPMSDEEELVRQLSARHLGHMSEDEFRAAFEREPSRADPQLEKARELLSE